MLNMFNQVNHVLQPDDSLPSTRGFGNPVYLFPTEGSANPKFVENAFPNITFRHDFCFAQ